jgi:hypothetical protein
MPNGEMQGNNESFVGLKALAQYLQVPDNAEHIN